MFVVVLAVVAVGWAAEPVALDSIDNVRTTIEKWVETKQVISQEKQDWALGREMLNERIELVEREIASLREKIAQAQESISDADKKRVELVDENAKLKVAAETLRGIVTQLEARTVELVKQLPDPIRERIKPLSQRLPEDPDATELSLAQRFQNVIGILNEVNKFNREITVTSEVRTLADGSVAEVTALYVGLGQAYYTGANGTVAGVGRPGPDGWTWEPANEAAAEVADAVSILKNEMVANFVLLPVSVQDAAEVPVAPARTSLPTPKPAPPAVSTAVGTPRPAQNEKERIEKLYEQSWTLYSEGRLEAARAGFIEVRDSGLFTARPGQRPEDYIATIDRLLAENPPAATANQ
jgi:FtsZ-binding cell division protein ZapB